jgi:hypothetical protein
MNTLWRSAPQSPVPIGTFLTSIAVLWLGPMVVGRIAAFCVYLATPLLAPETQLILYNLSLVLIFSPVYAWVGWLVAAPILWFLLRDGWFGWGSAALAGLIVGFVAGSILETGIAIAFGPLALLTLRAGLGYRLPLGLAQKDAP